MAQVTDGTSTTLMVGERPPNPDLFLGWWYAGMGQDFTGSGDTVMGVQEKNTGGHPGIICPFGAYQFGPGGISEPCAAFHYWSLHFGSGANFLFADGSVHWIPYSAASIMPLLASRAGGEVVELPE